MRKSKLLGYLLFCCLAGTAGCGGQRTPGTASDAPGRSKAAATHPAPEAQWIRSIPPVRVRSGEEGVVVDFASYYAPTLRRVEVKGVLGAASLEPVTVTAVASPADGRFTALQISGSGEQSVRRYVQCVLQFDSGASLVATLLVEYDYIPQVTFNYKSASTGVKNVYIAGSFNGWNSSSHALEGPGPDGSFSRILSIPPGRHTYKYVVDGQWIPDTANPNREPDGYQGFNSVIEVQGASKAASYQLLSIPELSGKPDNRTRFLCRQLSPRDADASVKQSHMTPRIMLMGGNQILASTDPAMMPQSVAAPTSEIRIEGNVIEIVQLDHAAQRAPDGILRVVFDGGDTAQGEAVLYLPPHKMMEPDWRGQLLYFAMTDRFCDGDGGTFKPLVAEGLRTAANYHGGDWAGIIGKIEEGYLDRLGVGALWISPVNQQTEKAEIESIPPGRLFSAYHGYWPVSPTETNPRFGTMDDLRRLVATARKHDIRVLFDLVCNHVHEDHPWHRDNPQWFGPLLLPDGTRNIRLFDAHPFTTWFDTFLPTIDYASNPEAIAAVTDNAIWWLRETGADGFRHDAVKHIQLDFWRTLTRKLRAEIEWPERRRLYQVGETISSRGTIAEFVGGDLLDGQFDFPLYWPIRDALAARSRGLDDLAREIEHSERFYQPESLMSPLIGNHDVSRFMAFSDGDLRPDDNQEKDLGWAGTLQVDHPEAYARLTLAHALLLTLPGNPMLYYGDEIGLTGAQDPDNRRPMRFGADLSPIEQRTLDQAGILGRLRRASSALTHGAYQTIHADTNTLAYARIRTGNPGEADQAMLVVIVREDGPRELTIALPENLAAARRVTPRHPESEAAATLQAEIRDGAVRLTLTPPAAVILELGE